MNLLDTIAAVSTPYGKGGIAVIRISGKDALVIAERVFSPANGKKLSEVQKNLTVYGRIYSQDGEQIDDGMGVCFYGPNSFTGEDTVEISCHGGILITQQVLLSVLGAGARAAGAGEFTRRAFVNGKMKLTSAEALGNLLEASTGEQIKVARSGMRGSLSKKTDVIYDSLGNILASVFAHIDYPDEDLADMSKEDMLLAIRENIRELGALCDTYKTGRAVVEGIPTAIAGRPNAGKSSLYNKILGREAAIVTDIEGTTRDVLTETTLLGRVLLRLSDTAGIRSTGDVVEKIGVERAMRQIEDAELVLAIFDGSTPPTAEDEELKSLLCNKGCVSICLLNKSDKGICPEAERFSKEFEYSIGISAQSGAGMTELASLVESIYIDKSLDIGADAIISNARQHSAAARALESLNLACSYIQSDLPLEVCCAELEAGMSALGELDGRTVSEDIVSKIFANFCVGK